MFNARRFWLLMVCGLAACHTTNELNTQSRTEFRYVNQAGDVAVWDIEADTITYSDDRIELSTCNAGNNRCFEASGVKVVVPKSCEKDEFGTTVDFYKPQHGVEPFSLEGLTGGIHYLEVDQKKFGYTYHPLRGITNIKLIPSNLPIQVDSGFKIVPYVYYIENYEEDDGPFPCDLAK